MLNPGGSKEEQAIPAGELNQHFIGDPVGFMAFPGEAIYGTIGGVRITEEAVTLALAGIAGGNVRSEYALAVDQDVFLLRGGHSIKDEVLGKLDQIRQNIDDWRKKASDNSPS